MNCVLCKQRQTHSGKVTVTLLREETLVITHAETQRRGDRGKSSASSASPRENILNEAPLFRDDPDN